MKHKLLTMAVAMLSLAACTSEENIGNDPLKDTPIKLNVSVDNPTTRAGYSNEVLPDSFFLGVYHDFSSDTDKYNYLSFVEKEGNSWKTYDLEKYTQGIESPVTMLWANMTDHVAIFARTTASDNITLQTDQSNEDKLKATDELLMLDLNVTPSIGGIEVKFKHLMSKIHLTIELGDEYEFTEGIDQKIKNVKIEGTKVEGEYYQNVDTNEFEFNTRGDAAPVTPLLTGSSPYSKAADGTITKTKATYEVILVPQTIAADGFSVSFEVDGKTYKWTYGSELTLATGTAYTLKLTAGDDKVQPATFEAAPWGAGNGEEGEDKETD